MWALAVRSRACPERYQAAGDARKTDQQARESLSKSQRCQEERHRIPLKSLRRAHVAYMSKLKGGSATKHRLGDESAAENSGRTLEGNEAQESIGL